MQLLEQLTKKPVKEIRIAIGGKVTGLEKVTAKKDFADAMDYFKKLGYTRISTPFCVIERYFKDLIAIEEKRIASTFLLEVANADVFIVLPSWQNNSIGTRIEIAFCHRYNIPVVEAYTFKQITPA